MRRFVAMFALLLAVLACAPRAYADKRVALLIGNGSYRNVAALANPRNDVRLLKKVLDEAGFDDVRTAFDLGQKDLVKALRAFTDEASDADIAVIYYSGHGMEMGGVNYLVPVDAILASDIDVPDETVTLDRVLQAIDGAKRLKLVILDACRSNPFLASMAIRGGRKAIEKGLAPVEPPDSDTLIAFAAKGGTPALDGDGSNSPFAAVLARRLTAPGVDVQLALREVRDDVLAATHRRQEPFSYGSLGGTPIPLSKALTNPEPAPSSADAAAAALHAAMAADTIAALDGFLAEYPTGPLADVARGERERLATKPPAAPVTPEPAPTGSGGGFGGVGAANPESVMKQCGDEWKAAKAAGTTNGQTWPEFYKNCKAQKEGAAAPAAAPTGESVMKQCGDEWKAAKAAGTTNGRTWPEFYKNCKAQKEGAATSAAAPTGAGEFTTEAEAKSRCPTDTVVWVNTMSHHYHYAGQKSYGTTKQGAYMCEADAEAAGDVATKGEKPKS